eukprot:gene25311-biopygen9020
MDAYSVHNVTPGTAPRGTPDCTVRYRDTRRCVAATLGARLHAALPRPAPGCGNAKNTTFEPRSISSNYVYTAEGTQNIGGGGGVSPHTGCFFFPREGGARWPVLSSVRPSVSGSRTRFPPRNGGPELAARIAQKLDFFGPWPRPARLEGPVCPLSVCGSVTGPPKSTENPQGSLWFWRFPPLVLASRSPWPDLPGTRFWGVPGQGAGVLARGVVVPGRGPGVSRGPRQSQGSARAGAGQSVGQSHCRAWQQL